MISTIYRGVYHKMVYEMVKGERGVRQAELHLFIPGFRFLRRWIRTCVDHLLVAFDLVFKTEQWSLVSTGSWYGIIIPAEQIETRARVGAVQLLCPLSGCSEPSLSDRAHTRFARRGSLITRGTWSCLGYAPGCSVSKKQYELGLKIKGKSQCFRKKNHIIVEPLEFWTNQKHHPKKLIENGKWM